MEKAVSFDGETISINAKWLAEQIAEGEIDAKQLWVLMHHELLHLSNMRERKAVQKAKCREALYEAWYKLTHEKTLGEGI